MVHTTISNAKRLLLDVHHRIDDDFLQNYLNEFVYKLNRKYFKDLFPRLLKISVKYRWNYLGERNELAYYNIILELLKTQMASNFRRHLCFK